MRNVQIRSLFMLGALLITSIFRSACADILSNNAFLYGQGIELGIGSDAAFGSDVHAPSGFFSGKPIGFICDKNMDGFGNGYDGDFFMPGSPEEGWAVSINGTHYNNNNNIQAPEIKGESGSTGQFSNFIDNNFYQSVDWTGKVENLLVKKTYRIYKSGVIIFIDVTLENTSSSPIENVYYMRTVDPDNNVNNQFNPTGTYATTNTIGKQGSTDGLSYVTASQTDGSELSLVGYATNSRVSYGGLMNRNPVDVYNATNGLSGGGSHSGDESISLAFKFEQIGAKEKVKAKYSYNLSSTEAVKLTFSNGDGLERYVRRDLYHVGGSALPIVSDDIAITGADEVIELVVSIDHSQSGDKLIIPDTLPDNIVKDMDRSSDGQIAFMGLASKSDYLELLKQIKFIHQSDDPRLGERKVSAAVLAKGFVPSSQIETLIDVTIPLVIDTPIAVDNVISHAEIGTVNLTGSAAPLASIVLELKDTNDQKFSIPINADANGQWQVTLPGTELQSLAEGELTLSGESTDANGVKSSQATAIEKDVLLTDIEITNSVVDDGKLNKVEANAFILEGTGEPGSTIVLELIDDESGKKLTFEDVVDEEGNWSIKDVDISTLSDGLIRGVLTQTDQAGNKAVESFEFVKDTQTYITLSDEAVSEDGIVSAADSDRVNVSGTGEPSASVGLILSDKNGRTLNKDISVDEQGAWSFQDRIFDITSLSDGDIHYHAVITDAFANEAETVRKQFLKDTEVDSVAILSPGSNGAISHESPVIQGTAEIGANVVINDGEKVVCTTTARADTTWQCQLSELSLGEKVNYAIDFTDHVGNKKQVALAATSSKPEEVQVVNTVVSGSGGVHPMILFLMVCLMGGIRLRRVQMG